MFPRRSAIFFPFLLLFSLSVFAQNQKRAIIIKPKDGEPMKGFFVSADSSTLKAEVGGIEVEIKLDAVESIFFSDETPPKPSTPQAALDAVKALRKLTSAADVGISYVNYAPLVVEAKTTVDDALLKLPEGNLKEAIQKSMLEYEYAASVWNLAWRDEYITDRTLKDSAQQYGVKKHGLLKVVWRSEFLSAIWAKGRNYFQEAVNLSSP